MRAHFEFLSGGRQGSRETLAASYITLGRHPESTVRFDSDTELKVSARHAAVFHRDGLFVLRDLGSVNGTFVNGRRLTADHVLADEDVIQFGHDGPAIRFWALREAHERTPAGFRPRLVVTAPPASTPIPSPAAPPREWRHRNRPSPGTTTRIRAEVARQTAAFRRWALALGGIAAAAWGALVWQGLQTDARVEAERDRLLTQVDSLTRELSTLTINVDELEASLENAERETERLRSLISRDDQSNAAIQTLSRDLQDALAHQRHIALAAALDPETLAADNQAAVGILIAEFADGTRRTATGFGVRSDRSGGIVVTNRHVVMKGGQAPVQLSMVFDGSRRTFDARVLSSHELADVALVRVDHSGGIPVVSDLNWREPPVVVGDAVGIIGYPFGMDLPMGGDWKRVGVSATFVAGSVSRVLPTFIQIDGFGTQGSSGSPVLDAKGQVVGIIYGGEQQAEGRIVYAAPVGAALELLDRLR